MNTTEKPGSPCPEFWTWLPQAYHNGDVGIQAKFTKYNMEVAFLAGKQFAFNQLSMQKQNITENMNTLQAAAQQALAALKEYQSKGAPFLTCDSAVAALEAALEQTQFINQCAETCERAKLCAICAAGLEQTEQEPVAWMCSDETLVYKGYSRFSRTKDGPWNIPVYTHPPRREWQGLTDTEIGMEYVKWDATPGVSMGDFARAIEAALKEKNK